MFSLRSTTTTSRPSARSSSTTRMPTDPSPTTTTWSSIPTTFWRPRDCSIRQDTSRLVMRANTAVSRVAPAAIRTIPKTSSQADWWAKEKSP